MASTSTELLVKLVADSKGFSAELGKATRDVDTLSHKMDAFGKSAQDVGKRMSLAITLPIAAIAKAGYDELADSQKVLAQTGAVLKSTGSAANVTAKSVDGLAQRLSALSGVDDEVIASSENVLLTFTKIRNEAGKGNNVFDQATKSVLDMSVALGEDLQSASIQVGKALNDPIQGVTALRRVGVSFTVQQREQIKAMVEVGDTLGAQKLILHELNTEFGGSAKAFGDTLPGQVAKAKNAFDEMTASLLVTALPAITAVTHAFQAFAKFVQDAPGPIRLAITALAGIAAIGGPALYVVGTLSRAFASLAEVAPNLAGSLATIGKSLAGVAAGAAVGIGAYEATTLALHAIFDKADKLGPKLDALAKSASKTADALDADLAASFHNTVKAAHDADQLGISPFVARLVAFKAILDVNRAAAERLAEQFRGHPALYKAMQIALANSADAQRRHAADAEKNTEALKSQEDQLKDLNDYIKSQEDASLGLDRAYLSLNDSLAALYISFHDATQSASDHQKAILDTKGSIEDYGHAVFEANRVSSGSTEEAARAQIYSLGLVAGGLAPGSDLRVWLEQYIDRLSNGIPKHIATAIEIATYVSGLSAADQNYLNSIPTASFAGGGVVPGPLGAPMPAIVHGGERIYDPLNPDPSMGGYNIGGITIVAPSPVEAANQIVQRLRAESFLAGMN